MAKKERKQMVRETRQIRKVFVPADATVRRLDGGGAVELGIVLQPEAVRRLVDQILNALLGNGRRRS